MHLDLGRLQNDYPFLIPVPNRRSSKEIAYPLKLPRFPCGRGFDWAELVLPKGFPDHAPAKIRLSPDAILRIPHVGEDGVLCVEGDPGPGYDFSAEDRIGALLHDYWEFLEKWKSGQLDCDFEKEPLNYWDVFVSRERSRQDLVRVVWTVDECPREVMLREGILLLPRRIVIAAAEEHPLTQRLIRSLGASAQQWMRMRVADIPIEFPLTPGTWPRNKGELERLLISRLRPEQYRKFWKPLRARQRSRGVHRLVLLRNADYGFAYLFPGGPPTTVGEGAGKRAYPSRATPLPLKVERQDPSWTVGRDQHPQVSTRQRQHVVVLGVGALGSPVVDYLAKAGIGTLTLVDNDTLVSANVGRHLLGTESLDRGKAEAVARRINQAYPATTAVPREMKAERWLQEYALSDVDLILDLTGEEDVRRRVEWARQQCPCPLLVGWMEPYVAAAHACVLPTDVAWLQGAMDPMETLQAVDWPDDVVQQEPGCSSRFQSYTASAAAYAVALVADNAIKFLDEKPREPRVISWVRGQRFLDSIREGLKLRDWAKNAASHDGMVLERSFP